LKNQNCFGNLPEKIDFLPGSTTRVNPAGFKPDIDATGPGRQMMNIS